MSFQLSRTSQIFKTINKSTKLLPDFNKIEDKTFLEARFEKPILKEDTDVLIFQDNYSEICEEKILSTEPQFQFSKLPLSRQVDLIVPKNEKTVKKNQTKISNQEDQILSSLIKNLSKKTGDIPFYIINLKWIFSQFQLWKKHLPRITPYYAVKCNNNIEILKLLYQLGAGFDCASKKEIQTIKNIILNEKHLNSKYKNKNEEIEDRIIYANPTKPNSHIEYANSKGVKYVTVDNIHEMYKLKNKSPKCKILIRIKTDDSGSLCEFSSKFGADLKDSEEIIKIGKKLDLNICGVSFHVGSNCKNPIQYNYALRDTKKVFEIFEKYNPDKKLNMIDIGGGYPGDNNELFLEMSKVINESIDTYFKNEADSIKFISEPGRYFATNSHSLVCQIVSRRDLTEKQIKNLKSDNPIDSLLYMNDGLYGSFNCLVFDHVDPKINLIYNNKEKLEKKNVETIERKKFKMFGPTCDSIDVIFQNIELPSDIKPDDFMYFKNFGAYTSCASSDFNGFKNHLNIYAWY